MKNKNEKCCASSKCCKMNGMNIFIGLLIGAVVLVFGWKIYLQQNPTTTPEIVNVDSAIEKIKEEKAKIEEEVLTEEGTEEVVAETEETVTE